MFVISIENIIGHLVLSSLHPYVCVGVFVIGDLSGAIDYSGEQMFYGQIRQ